MATPTRTPGIKDTPPTPVPAPVPAPTPVTPSVIFKQVVKLDGVKYLQVYKKLQNGTFQPAMIPVLQSNGTYQMIANKVITREELQAQVDALAADIALIDAAP